MAVTYGILVLGYTCVNIAIGIINIITVPLIGTLGKGDDRQGYLLVVVIYGCIFALCHIFCFAKTKEVVEVPEKEKISLKVQLTSVAKNKPYLIAVAGQFLFGVTLYGRNADALYYFTYVEGNPGVVQYIFPLYYPSFDYWRSLFSDCIPADKQ